MIKKRALTFFVLSALCCSTAFSQVVTTSNVRTEWVEVVEEYEVEVTRWEPVTTTEVRQRTIKKPVYVQEVIKKPVCSTAVVSSTVTSNVCPTGTCDFITTPVWSQVSSTGGVVSVPRVKVEGPFRTVERRDNFTVNPVVVDGYQGTATGGVNIAPKPAKAFVSPNNGAFGRRGLFSRRQ